MNKESSFILLQIIRKIASYSSLIDYLLNNNWDIEDIADEIGEKPEKVLSMLNGNILPELDASAKLFRLYLWVYLISNQTKVPLGYRRALFYLLAD